ncbi:DUF3037 domain-containing protein [Hymenobacter ginsengisoli]|uniref:DUF3037 domain-containing protein n=1 Tax=Hymenobacter ginsengisoli TaxID=1051626 RepID=A0ABP8QKM1_9BACT|nr:MULTISPECIES: DUF3037 domain-containing protein [unclassified Hymenobacter]MBO2029759.1 DUF3037 domain-containing protein [Hymenobacter sp. BT559]
MPAKHLFEYAVLRVVPRVEREEFLNVGVILYCASQGFLQATCELNEARLRAFSASLDLPDVRERLRSFERICGGRATGGPIGQLAPASRFRWLTAQRSTVVQTSPVHPGFCEDAATTLARLHAELVQ